MILTDLLDAAGAEYRVSVSSKDEITLCCPFCVERGEAADNRFRFGLNIRKAAGSCFNCKKKVRGVDYAVGEFSRIYGIRRTLRMRKAKELEQVAPVVKEELEPTGLPVGYETLAGKVDFVGRACKDYLKQKRGVSVLQIVKHKVGYAAVGPYAWRVLFPVYGEDGLVYGYVGRAVKDSMQPKYLNSPNVKLLWNAHKPIGKAVVVEGILDALRVETALLQVRNATAVARLGGSITSAQLDQLKAFDSVAILPDWDKAGVQGAIDLGERCVNRGIQVSVCVPQRMSGIDPGDMLPDQIIEELRNAIPWTKQTRFRLRAAAVKSA